MAQWKSDLSSGKTLDTIQHSHPRLWAGKAHRPKHGGQRVRQPPSADCYVWQLPGQQLLSRRAADGHPEDIRHGRFVSDTCDDWQLQEKAIAWRFKENKCAGFWETQKETRLGGEVVERCIRCTSCHCLEQGGYVLNCTQMSSPGLEILGFYTSIVWTCWTVWRTMNLNLSTKPLFFFT